MIGSSAVDTLNGFFQLQADFFLFGCHTYLSIKEPHTADNAAKGNPHHPESGMNTARPSHQDRQKPHSHGLYIGLCGVLTFKTKLITGGNRYRDRITASAATDMMLTKFIVSFFYLCFQCVYYLGNFTVVYFGGFGYAGHAAIFIV